MFKQCHFEKNCQILVHFPFAARKSRGGTDTTLLLFPWEGEFDQCRLAFPRFFLRESESFVVNLAWSRTKQKKRERKARWVSLSLSVEWPKYSAPKKTFTTKKGQWFDILCGAKARQQQNSGCSPFHFVQSPSPLPLFSLHLFYPTVVLGNSVMPRCDGGRGEGEGRREKKAIFARKNGIPEQKRREFSPDDDWLIFPFSSTYARHIWRDGRRKK